MADLKKAAREAIDEAASELHKLSEDIWNHPELALKETRAHETLTNFLTQHGFEVRVPLLFVKKAIDCIATSLIGNTGSRVQSLTPWFRYT